MTDMLKQTKTILESAKSVSDGGKMETTPAPESQEVGVLQAVEKRTCVLVVVQLIHRLTQADISCTTTARLFSPHCLVLCHFYCPKLIFFNSPTKERKTDSVARGTASLRGLQPGGSSATEHPWRHPRRAARDRGHQEGRPLNSSQCAPYISGI